MKNEINNPPGRKSTIVRISIGLVVALIVLLLGIIRARGESNVSVPCGAGVGSYHPRARRVETDIRGNFSQSSISLGVRWMSRQPIRTITTAEMPKPTCLSATRWACDAGIDRRECGANAAATPTEQFPLDGNCQTLRRAEGSRSRSAPLPDRAGGK